MTVCRCFLFFLLGIDAFQDLRKREIFLFPTVFYSFLSMWRILVFGEKGESLLLSCVPGLLVFGLALCTSGQIGIGDAWVLLAIGIEMEFFSTLGILWLAFLAMDAVSLYILIAGKKQKNGKTELPMVPFLFAAAVFWQFFSF